MIPAAFDYIRASTADEAFAELQRLGADARVLAGGQSLIPAMRFRLARPAVLVDINALTDLDYIRVDGPALALGAIARDSASSAHRGSASRSGACSTTSRGSWPIPSSGRWARSSAACATTIRRATGPRWRWPPAPRSSCAARRVRARCRSTSSSSTASRLLSGKARWRLRSASRFPTIARPAAYQKVERKVGDFATAAAAVQVSLDADGTVREAGIALSAAGPCAVRVAEAEALLRGQKPTAELIRAAADAAAKKSAPQADLRGSVEYKKNLAGVLVSRGLRQALARLGVQS